MAEDEAKEGKENKRFFGGTRDKIYNFFQPIIPFARKRMEENYGVDQQSLFHQINREVNLPNLGAMNEKLGHVEKAMDKLNQFKEDAMHLQTKIGPYSTWPSVLRELQLVREGFFEKEDFDNPNLLRKDTHIDFPIGKLVASKDGFQVNPKRFTIPLPKRRVVILEHFFHPPYKSAKDSMSYHYVSYFGEKRTPKWKKRFEELLDEIFDGKDEEGKTLADRYKEYIQQDSSLTNATDKKQVEDKIEAALETMKGYYMGLINKALDHTHDMEKQVREDLDEVSMAHKNLHDVRNECFTEEFNQVNDIFSSPPLYNVVYPYKVENNERIVPTGASLTKGWPREYPNSVGGKDFDHHLSSLHTTLFMFAQLDTLRDDIRDGRKRKSSLSVMEYLMSQHKVRGLGKAHLGERSWTMVNSENSSLPGTKKPTQFNPAFDLRAKDSGFTHEKGLYFDVHSHHVDTPLISTRGGAMYIVDRVMMNMANWEEAKSMLRGIGEQIKGFDIGARPWELFGEPLPTDPFAVDKEALNKKPAKTKPRKLEEIT